MGGGKQFKNKTYARYANSQHKAAARSDEIALFERLMHELGPELVKDLANSKLDDRQLLEKYKKYAAARLVVNTVREVDSGKSSAAANSILDRTTGKPVEKREIVDKRDALSDEELKALVKSKMDQLMAEEGSE